MSSATADLDLAGVERAYLRSQAYGLLARALSEPSRALDEDLPPALGRVLAELGEPADLLAAVEGRRGTVADLRGRPRVVDQEFTALFVKSEAPPYEGSYVPGVRLTQEIADVAGFLQAFGLRASGERPDHLVSELELMALLCLKEAVAVANGLAPEAGVTRDAQASFLRDHLGRWLAAYEEEVRARASLPLYPALAGIVRTVVERDAGRLGVVPERIAEVPSGEPESIPGCGLAR